ncbi:MAG: DUF5916 domain-containing protein [Bacteroidales bacterium]
MHRIVRTGAVATWLLTAPALTGTAHAQAPVPASAARPSSASPSLRIARLTSEPKLDDFLDGESPDGMTRITGFLQREPTDGAPISRDTVVYLGYDNRNLYAVFVCKEDRGVVRAHMAKRESIMGDDIVGIILDTFHDRRHAYEFFVNPLGIQMDGVTSDGQDDDWSFDTVWRSEGRLTPDGYIARIAIPFRSLRFRDEQVQEWGIAVARLLPTRNETSFWPRVTRQISSFGQQLATLDGLQDISPGRNLQFIPYGAFTGARYFDEGTGMYGDREEGRAGVDAKVVLKDALTLDFAANPDFSQVESDEPQVTINQRFEVQFPEKRPFFIENSSYFNTPEELFFSRRIIDPRVGARLTGRVGKWNVAGLVMDDRAPGEQVPAGSPWTGDATVVAVGRVVREFARQSTAGAFVSDREFGTTFNRVVSADTRLRFGDHWITEAQAIVSRTATADERVMNGQAFLGNVSYSSRALNFETSYTDRSPGFRSDVGFVPRSDIRLWNNDFGYKFYPTGKTLISWGPAFEGFANWDHRQRLQEWEVSPEFQIELPSNTQLHMFAGRAYELYKGIGFDKHTGGVFFYSEWFGWLSGSLGLHLGDGINYYPAAGLLPFLANNKEIEVGATLKPVPQFRIEETYIFDSLTTGASSGTPQPPGTGIFDLHMWRTKANYQFTRALSLRAIVDYNLVTPNTTLVELDPDKRFTLDILATYLVNPGTAVYVGVTDAYADLVVDPRLSPLAPRPGGPMTSTGRQFFVKMSYLFRF